MTERAGVLVMAYGTPRNLDEVESYYTHIRHGRPPPEDLLEELKDRYRAIGGASPLLEITESQAAGIAARVEGAAAYVGYKHSPPFIEDAVAAMARDRVEAAVGIVMAPHFSAMSVGEYASRARRAADAAGWHGRLEIVKSWHLEPGYVAMLADRVNDARSALPAERREKAPVVFTAHSLPEKILNAADPYPAQLEDTARAVAAAASLSHWMTAWQSAGRTDAKWLGPDLCDVVADLAAGGAEAMVVCPCGFVADHLEVLYDVDIEAAAVADALGISLVRTRSPNADAEFLDAVAKVVSRALQAIHVASR